MTNENWIIWHDNGVAGQMGYTDGYKSREECLAAVEQMMTSNILVYEFYRAD